MKVQELISRIESEEKYPTGFSLTIAEGKLMEGYFRDEDGQFWQIRKVNSNDL